MARDSGMDDAPDEPPPRIPEEGGARVPPNRRPPTALGAGTFEPADWLGDRYLIERRLEWPGAGNAYLAKDVSNDRPVVIRVFPATSAGSEPSPVGCAMGVAARLAHPSLLRALEAGEVKHFEFMVFPYAPGEWLWHRLQRERQLPVPDALEVARQVNDLLVYAHASGLIHGDLSPACLYLTPDRVLVADFGLALSRQQDLGAGHFCGTLPYLSPERIRGRQPVDPRADIYALGAILHEMLTGTPPFGLLSHEIFAARDSGHLPPSARQVRAAVPRGVDAAIRRALAPDRDDRFADAAAFALALEWGASDREQPGPFVARLRALLGLDQA